MSARDERGTRRAKLRYVPRFTRETRGYTAKQVRNFARQLRPLHEEEDLWQEAWLVFLKCKRKYMAEGAVDNAAWFMSLYKTALHRRFLTLLERNGTGNLRRVPLLRDVDGESVALEVVEEVLRVPKHAGEALIALSRVSHEILSEVVAEMRSLTLGRRTRARERALREFKHVMELE